MTPQEFHHDLKVFFREAITIGSDRDDLEAELIVQLQPNMVILTGEYFIESTRHPLDFRIIGKAKCRQIREKIETYHFNTTTGGVNKWNVGKWIYRPNGDIEEYLHWDIEWEEKNKMERLHKHPEYLTAPKWHWEEKQ